MPFRYRLQKILDFRIRRKKEQLLVVQRAQTEVFRIVQLIEKNKNEIMSTRINMKKADYTMYDAYDKYLKSLYEKEDQLLIEKTAAEEVLQQEKEKLFELEKEVNVLEKHKEKAHELYKDEEKKLELKRLSEIGTQRHFAKTRDKNEDELLEELQEEFEKLKKSEGFDY